MAKAGHNGFDVEMAKRFTGEVMRVFDELDQLKIENMNKARQIRERLPDLYEAAKEAGIPAKPFKAHVKAIRAQQAFERALDKAKPEDDEDIEIYEMLREIATPGDLFDHAVKARAGDIHDDDSDPRQAFLKEKESDRIARENAERIEKGITGLPNADAIEA